MNKTYYMQDLGHDTQGRRVTISWALSEDDNFTMQGDIWNKQGTDIESGGQNLEEIAALFPDNTRLQGKISIWRKYHLNDLKAGLPVQEAFVNGYLAAGKKYDYDDVVYLLKKNGLYEVDGYKYGTGWMKEEIPADVLEIIKSWANEPGVVHE